MYRRRSPCRYQIEGLRRYQTEPASLQLSPITSKLPLNLYQMLIIPKNTTIPRPLLERRLQSAYADAIRSGNTSRIISTLGACHRNNVPLSSPNTKKIRLRIAASYLQRQKIIAAIVVTHKTSNITPTASSSQSGCQRPSNPTLPDGIEIHQRMQITQHCYNINDIESWFDSNETMLSSPSLQVENDENHQPVNNNILEGKECTMLSDCEQGNHTVASCTKSMKNVSTMTLPPQSDITFESMCNLLTIASPPLPTPLKVFNGWTMKQETRAGRKAQQWYEDHKSVHFASPLAKKKMTPAEKQEAKDKAHLRAESRHRSQSSTKISKKRQNVKRSSCFLFANAMRNEIIYPNPGADSSIDSIASRVKKQHRAKTRYI